MALKECKCRLIMRDEPEMMTDDAKFALGF
jgi:hypothetical protein